MVNRTGEFYHSLKEIYLVQRPIRNAILANLTLVDLLNLRSTNSEVKQICDSYIHRNINMKIDVNNHNYADILGSTSSMKFSEVRFSNISITSANIEQLRWVVKKCDQLYFERCNFEVNISMIMDCCENLKMILFEYQQDVSMLNNTLQHEFPDVHVAAFRYNSSESIKEVSALIFANFLQFVKLNVISLPMNVYIWFAKFAVCCEKTINILHLKWHTTEFSNDDDIVTAISTPVYNKILLEISENVYNSKKNLIEMLNIPFKIYV